MLFAIRGMAVLSVAVIAACRPAADPQAPAQASRPSVEQPASPEPPIPFEDVGACPFEGCVYREWTSKEPIQVRTERRIDAPIAFTLAAGERVTALTGVVVTTSPGRVTVSESQTVSTETGEVAVEAGETLYLLTAQGEGQMKVWIRGRPYDHVDPARYGTVVAPWQSVWWVQVRNARGQTGWTHQPRSFHGIDARA